jgi:hypothetical protein
MRADAASDANEEETPLSPRSQKTGIIAEPAGEIKGYARSPPLPAAHLPGRVQLTFRLSVVYPSRRSQAKGSANALPQGTFFLDTDRRRETLPVRIQKH